ncbi:hypothetical protein M422DRAFT_63861 [Sphaerobolus stellatus SS14]|nr:hypothetical protein M422DRAFT_63861 [Sphaerobolus stellatus SS14]
MGSRSSQISAASTGVTAGAFSISLCVFSPKSSFPSYSSLPSVLTTNFVTSAFGVCTPSATLIPASYSYIYAPGTPALTANPTHGKRPPPIQAHPPTHPHPIPSGIKCHHYIVQAGTWPAFPSCPNFDTSTHGSSSQDSDQAPSPSS